MFEIKGNVNTAICYAKVVEDEAIEQIKRMCDYEFTRDSKVRIMPDVHAGKGCTIGTTMTIVDKAVPNIVGVDIGCGMLTVNLGKVDIDFAKLDEAAHFVPSGKNVWDGRKERFDLQALRCYRSLKETKWLERSLGTLGGGNHFIEVDEAADGTKYLVIHTGSRNLGKQVAEIYQQLAIDLHCGKEEYFKQRDAIIAEYKAAGRRAEIQAELKKLAASQEKKEADMPEDLCFLYGTYLEDYLHDVVICQDFARRNREKIAEVLMERAGLGNVDNLPNGGTDNGTAHGDVKAGAACTILGCDAFHTIHNYIDTDEMILRKGAIAAHAGEKVLIPINMRDGSVLAIGKGNPDWNYSAPHGAGRIMSRHKAKEQLNLADYKKAMEGIYTTSVNEATLDEAPMAYKSLEDIIDVVRDSVDIIDVMKPIYNFKAN
ncbi:MAG: RtcB family protein [Lachnospira sp.]|nr:RtcB family protein [Lachnospira sp.]